ncbi:MAG TPA: hypothetical protein VFP80_08810 [Thermoanaerobaculia bacterium]|nr:hypothetical protein [Thermoanaerobaculia bacterium]
MKVAGSIVLAALAGWLARGIRLEKPSPPPRLEPPVVQRSEPLAAPPAIVRRVPLEGTASGRRNLFAYPVHEQPILIARTVVQEPPAVAIPAPVPEAPAPPPIPFPYRYIGTFGPPQRPVAAFKRDGDVVTVFPGERIGDFVLRSIGVESVAVEGPDGTRRVPLTSDL